MINCKLCRNTEKCWFAGENHEVGKCKDYIKTTNGDRIRSMNDEELADFLGRTKACCCISRDPTLEFTEEFREWLKEEVEHE